MADSLEVLRGHSQCATAVNAIGLLVVFGAVFDEGCVVIPSGQDGVYDNVAAGKGRPQKKKGSGEEEDIYGGLGEGGEGIYDNASRGQAMRYSEDGLYDNPHGMGELCLCPVNLFAASLFSAAWNAMYVHAFLMVVRSRWGL